MEHAYIPQKLLMIRASPETGKINRHLQLDMVVHTSKASLSEIEEDGEFKVTLSHKLSIKGYPELQETKKKQRGVEGN